MTLSENLIQAEDTTSYLNVPAVARRFGKSEKTIRRWAQDGTLPYVKMGRGRNAPILFDWEVIKDHLTRRFSRNIIPNV